MVSIIFGVLQLLPGVKVVIANPETKGQCADSHLGEVCHAHCYLTIKTQHRSTYFLVKLRQVIPLLLCRNEHDFANLCNF